MEIKYIKNMKGRISIDHRFKDKYDNICVSDDDNDDDNDVGLVVFVGGIGDDSILFCVFCILFVFVFYLENTTLRKIQSIKNKKSK